MKGRTTNLMQQQYSHPSSIKMVFSHTVIQHHTRPACEKNTNTHTIPIRICTNAFSQLPTSKKCVPLKCQSRNMLYSWIKHICNFGGANRVLFFVLRLVLLLLVASIRSSYVISFLKNDQTLHENASFYQCPVLSKTCMVCAFDLVISIYYINIR